MTKTKLLKLQRLPIRVFSRAELNKKTKRKKLKAGVHTVTIKGKKRKVKVNSKGQWRFMKGRGR